MSQPTPCLIHRCFQFTSGRLKKPFCGSSTRVSLVSAASSLILMLWLVPSVVRAHFCWNWQCQTLNCGDELRSLQLCCIQPYTIHLANHTNTDGSRIGLGSVYCLCFTRQKLQSLGYVCCHVVLHLLMFVSLQMLELEYNFVLPHCDPLCCAVGVLVVLLHYAFDHQDLLRKHPDWDWSRGSTWHKVLSCKHGLVIG
jgi:hypothetical protein